MSGSENGKYYLPADMPAPAGHAVASHGAAYAAAPQGSPFADAAALGAVHSDDAPYASLPGDISALDESGNLKKLEDIEADMIRLAIEKYEGHMSEVARRLGIGRSTLYRKVRDLGIQVRD